MPEAQPQTPPVDPAETNGPGGVETPTQPVGGTPTPQPAEVPAGGLKPLTELLGQPAAPAEPAAPVEPTAPVEPAAPSGEPNAGPAGRINKLTAEKWEEKRGREAAEARARLAEET